MSTPEPCPCGSTGAVDWTPHGWRCALPVSGGEPCPERVVDTDPDADAYASLSDETAALYVQMRAQTTDTPEGARAFRDLRESYQKLTGNYREPLESTPVAAWAEMMSSIEDGPEPLDGPAQLALLGSARG